MSVPSQRIREEYFENEGVGVELEVVEAPGIERPWNPADIRVTTRQFSLRDVLDMVQDGVLELVPNFQRNNDWKGRQKSRLVESVLLQIPLPAFYFAEDASGLRRVVDGVQRLSTIHAFVYGGAESFKFVDLEYLRDEEGKRFDELPPAWRRRILNSQIVVHVIDPTTPVSVRYDIIKRINTGGAPLNAQEVRHRMSKPRSRDFLRSCTDLEVFDRATGGRFRDHIRMDDREVVLRFCAFYLYGVPGYLQVGSMDTFLESTTAALDNPSDVSDEKQQELRAAFGRAMENCYLVFGQHAFRKLPFVPRPGIPSTDLSSRPGRSSCPGMPRRISRVVGRRSSAALVQRCRVTLPFWTRSPRLPVISRRFASDSMWLLRLRGSACEN
jgi:hypothetical protein